MALKDTMKKMQILLEEMSADFKKAERGIKAAAQRVRTGTIKFAKLAKKYRKESMTAAKGSKRKSKKKTNRKKTVRKKTKTARRKKKR